MLKKVAVFCGMFFGVGSIAVGLTVMSFYLLGWYWLWCLLIYLIVVMVGIIAVNLMRVQGSLGWGITGSVLGWVMGLFLFFREVALEQVQLALLGGMLPPVFFGTLGYFIHWFRPVFFGTSGYFIHLIQHLRWSHKVLILLSVAVFGAGMYFVVQLGEPESERLVAKIDLSLKYFVASPDNQHVAHQARAGTVQVVAVDGQEGKGYNSVGRPIFSPNSKRVAYSARNAPWPAKSFVVVDGQESKKYDAIDSIIFSPDSRRVAYIVRVGQKQLVVVDGQEGKQYDDIFHCLTFSPDSKRVAYVARLGTKSKGTSFMVVDGQEGKKYNKIDCPTFSPDSKRVAYSVIEGNTSFPVIDGREDKRYTCQICSSLFIGPPVFSPDSQRLAYASRSDTGRMFAVVDGKIGKQYDKISSLTFSPNSKRVAYTAVEGNNFFVVVDGQEGKKYTLNHYPLHISNLTFSPDSKRVAYFVRVDKKRQLVVDGQEGKQYDAIGSLTFSPDSKRVAHTAHSGFKWFVVVDGKESKKYNAIQRFQEMHSTIGVGAITFDSPNSIHYLALKGSSVYLVEETIK